MVESTSALAVAATAVMPVAVSHRAPEALFREIYLEHAGAVRSLLARLCGPGLDADDLAHEVFVVAWRKLGDFDRGRSARAWLYGIAFKVAAGARRRARWRRTLGLSEEQVGGGEKPDEVFARQEAATLVYRALDPIAQRKRTVFILFELQGMPGPEIAELLQCPLKTVWSRLLHARREFDKNLKRIVNTPRRAREGGESR